MSLRTTSYPKPGQTASNPPKPISTLVYTLFTFLRRVTLYSADAVFLLDTTLQCAHSSDEIVDQGMQVSPLKNGASSMGASVDCTGPDAGSMLHTMSLGEDSLLVQPCPERRMYITKSLHVPGCEETLGSDTIQYILHKCSETIAGILESQLSILHPRIDFFGVTTRRIADVKSVIVLLRPKSSEPGEADAIITEAFDMCVQKLNALAEEIKHKVNPDTVVAL